MENANNKVQDAIETSLKFYTRKPEMGPRLEPPSSITIDGLASIFGKFFSEDAMLGLALIDTNRKTDTMKLFTRRK